MNPLKKIAHKICGDYELYWIYGSENAVPATALAAGFEFGELVSEAELASASSEISSLRSYLLPDSRCFVIRKEHQVVSACVYWWGQTYTTHRNFWNLLQSDAKLVQVSTVSSCRKLGLASSLISHSTIRMRESGFQRLFARIWHSNTPSMSAFERAGWKRVAFRSRFAFPWIGSKTFTRYYHY